MIRVQRPLTGILMLLTSLAVAAVTRNVDWWLVGYPLAVVLSFIPYTGRGIR